MSIIRRDFLPAELEKSLTAAGVDAVISVQARQSLEETRWLLQLAAENRWICGVVGWLGLTSADLPAQLEQFAAHPKLRAIRHVMQGEGDGFMLGADFNRGIALLADFGLAYDILIAERQLVEAIAFVDRHPQQVFILDHMAKPPIKEGIMEPWAKNMRELARRENVYCKISGLVTESQYDRWTPEQLRPYMQTALDAFTPERLMFGSDWPVCLVASGYSHWIDTVQEFAAGLSDAEQQAIFGQTAARAYQLDLL